MKAVWALLPLVASSGCLFLDHLNHAPSVETRQDDITTTHKGATLAVHADAVDVEDGKNLKLTYTVSLANPHDPVPLDPICDYESTPFSGGQFDITFYRTGTFEILVTATDSDNATATAAVMITITNAAPKFGPTAMVQQSSLRNACDLTPAGEPITLGLSGGDGGGVSDADSDQYASAPGCVPSEKVTYTWRISDWPAGGKPVLTSYDGVHCAKPTSLDGSTITVANSTDQVCLWTDETVAGASAMYSVVLDVSDGTTSVTSPAGNLDVAPDQPPCITGTNPVAGSYVVDRTQVQMFDVDGALDDRDAFGDGSITYAWSVYRALDNTWRQVPDWSLSSYELDPSSFGVGEKIEVRVEALDRVDRMNARPPSCTVDQLDCTPYACASKPNVCHKWKTWELELR
jgi:hypothetical protein